MGTPAKLKHYPLLVVMVVAGGFLLAYLAPDFSVWLCGLTLIAAPALLASALLRPKKERLFWLQAASLSSVSVLPLLSGIGGLYGVHFVAGLTALSTGFIFWALRSFHRQQAGRSTAASLAAAGMAITIWAWFAPIPSQIHSILGNPRGGTSEDSLGSDMAVETVTSLSRETSSITPNGAKSTEIDPSQEPAPETRAHQKWNAHERLMANERAQASKKWQAYEAKISVNRQDAERKWDAFDARIAGAPSPAEAARLTQEQAVTADQFKQYERYLRQQQSVAQTQSDQRLAQFKSEQHLSAQPLSR